jgi:hypothetical protein
LGLIILSILFVISIIELVFTFKFNSFFFNLGIIVSKKTIEINYNVKEFPLQEIIYKSEGKFFFPTKDKVQFLSYYMKILFITSSAPIPFPFKSTGVIKNDKKIDIICKIPIFTSLTYLYFFAFFSIFSYLKETIWLTWVCGGGGLFVFVIIVNYYFEKRNLKLMIEELKSIMSESKKKKCNKNIN